VVAKSDFSQLTLNTITIKKNIAYQVSSLPHLIVLRCVNRIIRSSTNIRPSDRDILVRQIITILKEGVPHRVYKFDVKKFFESINLNDLLNRIRNDERIPKNVTIILSKYIKHLITLGVIGIPRGIPLSATLAEYSMQIFDSSISRLPNVYYYARYVDDILIVTGAREAQVSFERQVERCLPFSLSFNDLKTSIKDIPIQKKSTGVPVIGDFDYLGYNR
jgi:retron-type reverse transcriptase